MQLRGARLFERIALGVAHAQGLDDVVALGDVWCEIRINRLLDRDAVVGHGAARVFQCNIGCSVIAHALLSYRCCAPELAGRGGAVTGAREQP